LEHLAHFSAKLFRAQSILTAGATSAPTRAPADPHETGKAQLRPEPPFAGANWIPAKD